VIGREPLARLNNTCFANDTTKRLHTWTWRPLDALSTTQSLGAAQALRATWPGQASRTS
jgi:hypothetical protein